MEIPTRYPFIRLIANWLVIAGWIGGIITLMAGFGLASTGKAIYIPIACIIAAINIGIGYLLKELTVVMADIADQTRMMMESLMVPALKG